MRYLVIFRATGQVVGTYATAKRARRAVDRKDNAYGAYIHSIKEVSGE